jgi:hypothetical protein
MRHAIYSAARAFAAMTFGQRDEDPPRDFQVTITRPGEQPEPYLLRLVTSLEATLDAIGRGGEGALIEVEPARLSALQHFNQQAELERLSGLRP